jgi:hypothetical protein
MSDQTTGPELAEQVDAEVDDPGGVPFDDELDDEPDETEDGRGGTYDSPQVMQKMGIGYPSSPPPGMLALKAYVLSRFGGADLGILSKPPRPMRGKSTPSLHNWGMAWDWRWQNPGPGRAVAEQVIAFCLDNTDTLGVQAVHDYQAGRYWKSYGGWRPGTPSATTGMGQPWGQWLHIERTWAGASNATAIADLLAAGGVTVPPAAAAPQAAASAPSAGALPTGPLKKGSSGADVGRMQDFLRLFKFADFTRSDGVFGPRTDAAVRKAQEAFKAKALYDDKIDGIWGKKSAAAGTTWMAQAAKG